MQTEYEDLLEDSEQTKKFARTLAPQALLMDATSDHMDT
jgi:hypothetical protein